MKRLTWISKADFLDRELWAPYHIKSDIEYYDDLCKKYNLLYENARKAGADKDIGIVVGTSKENVRYYCKTHGLGGTAAEAKERYKEQRKNPENCKQCGRKLERYPRSGKNCSVRINAV